LEVKSLAGVASDSQDEVFSSPKIQKLLFSEELIKNEENSPVIEVSDGRSVVFRVETYHEAGIHALAAVREKIRKELIEVKAKEFAASVGQALLARVSSGEPAEAVSKDMGIEWAVHKDVRRDNYSLDQELVKRVFAMQESGADAVSVRSFVLPSGDYAVVKLDAVNRQQNEEVTSIEKQSVAGMLARSFGAIDYDAYKSVALREAVIDKL